jgi:uncharacterized protein (DUF433 family)
MRQPASQPGDTPTPHAESVSELLQAIEERNGDAWVKGTRVSVKQIAWLYAYERKHPFDIMAMFPAALTHAKLHVALAHYYTHRESYDAEIAKDIEANRPQVLEEKKNRMPVLRLKALIDFAQEPEPVERPRHTLNPEAFPVSFFTKPRSQSPPSSSPVDKVSERPRRFRSFRRW